MNVEDFDWFDFPEENAVLDPANEGLRETAAAEVIVRREWAKMGKNPVDFPTLGPWSALAAMEMDGSSSSSSGSSSSSSNDTTSIYDTEGQRGSKISSTGTVVEEPSRSPPPKVPRISGAKKMGILLRVTKELERERNRTATAMTTVHEEGTTDSTESTGSNRRGQKRDHTGRKAESTS